MVLTTIAPGHDRLCIVPPALRKTGKGTAPRRGRLLYCELGESHQLSTTRQEELDGLQKQLASMETKRARESAELEALLGLRSLD